MRCLLCEAPAHAQEMTYCATEGDEVEDLLALLAFAKQEMPEIEAVSCGAIASDYQRLRVENVCLRLGLLSLAYLWMRPQAALLQGMIEDGIHAVIVKVAALGLEPHKHLGKTLKEMQPTLHNLCRKFACNICGEGGEYETLTLDCPLFLRTHLVLDSWKVALHSADSFASVGILCGARFHLQPKSTASDAYEASEARILEVPQDFTPLVAASPERGGSPSEELEVPPASASIQIAGQLCNAYCCPKLQPSQEPLSASQALHSAMHAALSAIKNGLQENGLHLGKALFVQLWLRDMQLFAQANAIYSLYFPSTNPAARACIQAPLASETPVAIHIFLPASDHAPRKILHVQSISQWAPSCIGPYSQAAVSQGLVCFAGQIGLHPPTMQLLPSLELQARQCIASCEAIAVALRIDLGSCLLGARLYSTPAIGKSGQDHLKTELQQMLHQSAEDSGLEGEPVGDLQGDVYLQASKQQRTWFPILTHLVMPALPKGALVEVQPIACSDEGLASCLSPDLDSESGHLESGRPGWISKLENMSTEEGGILSTTLCATGAFCHCSISGSCEEVTLQQNSGQNRQKPDQLLLLSLLQQLLESSRQIRGRAQLSSCPVALLCLYYRVRALEASRDFQTCFEECARQAVAAEFGCSLNGVALTPVIGVGLTAEANADLLLELLIINSSS